MAWIITVDIGTTAMKTGLFTEKLVCLHMVTHEYELDRPRTGWLELPPNVYLEQMASGIHDILSQCPEAAERVGAISLTSQGETLIFVDADNSPQHPAIIWLDSRAGAEARQLTESISNDRFYRMTGLPENNPAMPAAKVLWFSRNHPELFAKTRKVLLLVDWLALYLTGLFVSDDSIQSSTGWFNINDRTFWPEMLDAVGLRADQLPGVLSCGTSAGCLLTDVAKKLGLKQEVQVVLCGMDQASSAIGGGNFQSGVVCETTGTALVISAAIDKPDYERLERITFLAHVGGGYLMLPYCPTAGMLLKWFRREFAHREELAGRETGASVYELLDCLAESGKGWEKGLFLLPDFEGKLTPEPNPGACGVLFGLTLDTTRADMARALLESVGFMLRENIAMLEAYGVSVDSVRSLGGGAKSHIWGKIKADILQKTVYPQSFSESTSLGAAMLGQVASGAFPNLESAFAAAVAGAVEVKIRPDSTSAAESDRAYEQYKLVYQSLLPAFRNFRC